MCHDEMERIEGFSKVQCWIHGQKCAGDENLERFGRTAYSESSRSMSHDLNRSSGLTQRNFKR